MTTKNGGPAFPISDFRCLNQIGQDAATGTHDTPTRDRLYAEAMARAAGGMSLRDYFAAKALPLAFERYHYNLTKDLGDEWRWKDSDWEGVAYLAYGLADAMLKAREEA